MLRFGYRIPFLSSPPLSPTPVPMPSYKPFSHQRGCARGGHPRLNCQGCSGASSTSICGLLQPSVCRWKTSGSWRPVIDLSHLNRFVDVSHFQMETIQSVLLSVRQGDWMASIDLKEAYLQVPVHPESRPFLRFVSKGHIFQFKALCFGLSTAPQVFSRVMAPVSAILHAMGIRMRRYLDDWLVQSSSREPLLRDPDCPRALPRAGGCDQPGEIPPRTIPGGAVSWCHDQHPVFCGFSIARSHFQAAVNRRRISILRLASREVMALSAGHAFFAGSPSSWRQIADAVSPVVPQSILGSRRSLGSSVLDSELSSRSPVVAPPASPLPGCVPLPSLPKPRLLVRRLGRKMGCSSGSPGRFRPLGLPPSVYVHKRQGAAGHPRRSPPLSVVFAWSYGSSLLQQRHCSGVSPQGGRNQVSFAQHHSSGDPALVGVSRHPSGSTVYPGLQQHPGGRSVSPSPAPSFRVVPQHDRLSIFVSSVAGPNRFICDLRQSSMFDLFLSLPGSSVGGHGRLPPVLGRSAGLRLSSICHHSKSPREAPGISGDGAHPSGSVLGAAPLVSGSPPAVAGPSGHPSGSSRPPAPASISAPLPGSLQATTSCLETLRRFTRAAGFSSAVVEQSSLARRPSSRAAYQLRWSVYRSWCHSHGHSVSRPSLAKVADFLTWLRSSRRLGSMLSAVFRFHLPSLSSDPVLQDLLRSFKLSSAERVLRPPAWDLAKVLRYLNSPQFEPLSQASLRALSLKALFLLALATAKRVGELQALSSIVTFVGVDACLSYILQFVAKSESLTRSIPRSFLVKSLSDFAAGLDDDLLLCPVRALRFYLDRTISLSPLRHRLFVSPRRPSRSMSKNAVSFFLREVIHAAGASRPEVGSFRAHEVCSVSTSVAFHRNWSVSSVLESATWSSSSVFSSFYLRDIQHEYDGMLSLGPFVAAGSRIG